MLIAERFLKVSVHALRTHKYNGLVTVRGKRCNRHSLCSPYGLHEIHYWQDVGHLGNAGGAVCVCVDRVRERTSRQRWWSGVYVCMHVDICRARERARERESEGESGSRALHHLRYACVCVCVYRERARERERERCTCPSPSALRMP